jgi:hypothetical protein
MHHHPSGRDAQVLFTHPLHVVWVILPNILFILVVLPLKITAKAYKLWRRYCTNISDFLHPLSEVPVFEYRTLIAGERGTPAPRRGPIWRLDTAFRLAGLQQRWLSRPMMFRQAEFVNSELSISQATRRHMVSHVNRSTWLAHAESLVSLAECEALCGCSRNSLSLLQWTQGTFLVGTALGVLPYFPAYKTHRPVRRTRIFSLEILEKKKMNVF